MAHTETGKMKDDFGHLLDFLQNLKKLKVLRYTRIINFLLTADNLDNEVPLKPRLHVALNPDWNPG